MHIAFLNPQGNFDPEDSYWAQHPDFGGQLVYVKEVAFGLAALGHDVDIITRQVIDPEWPEFRAKQDYYPGQRNLRIIRIPCGPDGFLEKEQLWPYLLTQWVPNILAFYKSEKRLPTVFTAHYGDGGLAGAALQDQTGIHFSFTAHSLGAQKMDKLGVNILNVGAFDERYHFTARIAAEQTAISHAGGIITSTSQEKEIQYGHPAYKNAFRVEEHKLFSVIPPGVNMKIFSRNTTHIDDTIEQRIRRMATQTLTESRAQLPYIVTASRLDPKKNITGLMRAYAQSEELKQKANLLFAVRGPVETFQQEEFFSQPGDLLIRELNSMIQLFELGNKLLAVPLNGQHELASAYRYLATRHSVFILPAIYEAFGLAPLEAMACGLPAVVTKYGGPMESMVEGDREYGVLIDPEDPHDIASGCLRLIANREEWTFFQKSGMERVSQKYTWQRTAAKYAEFFGKILHETSRAMASEPLLIPEYFYHPVEENSIPVSSLDWIAHES